MRPLMQRRQALKLLSASAMAAAAPASRPNVLFVISDDLNNDFGGLGRLGDIHSPHLDRLAARGVRFEHAYCQYPLCNPSRTSLFSGLRPTTTQVLDNVTPPRYAVPDFITLPQHLRAEGYQARYFGKVFHLLDPPSWNDNAPPPDRKKVNQFNYWIEPVTERNPEVAASLRSMMEPNSGAPETLEDYKIASDAIGALRNFQSSQPFFLAVGFHRPHVPLIAPRAMLDLYSPGRVRLPADFGAMPGWKNVPDDAFRPNLDLFFQMEATMARAQERIAAYYGCVSFLDSQLGRLLDELERLDLTRNTIIVVVADHGWHLGQKGMWAKMTLFENSANVPLLISDPRKSTGGARCRAIVESLDIYPTLVDLCGLPMPRHLEGRSLARLLDHPGAAWDEPARTVMLRNGNLARTVRTVQWRYTEWDGGRRGAELYDHEHDGNELENLAGKAKYAGITSRLRRILG
jgi:iduronate 2-sulfatase